MKRDIKRKWCRLPPVHEVRAVATNTGYKYYFDKQGGVYSWWKGELRKQRPHKVMNKRTLLHNKNGGYQIICSGAGRSKGKADRGWLYVHRGVALAFPEICGVPNLIQNQVDHRNDNKYDNRAKNLQWLSPSENVKKRKTIKKVI